MKKMLMTTVGLSLLVFSASVAADDSYTATCEELGYKTDLADCTVGLPLLCPISGNETQNKLKCLCMTESCRGYSLTEKNLDEKASDGRMVREHIKELETCDSGVGADKVTYYRIKECQEGSLYQIRNGKPFCDIGCPRKLFPYDKHPGDSPGKVISCKDEKGTYYGFEYCNQGWIASGEAGHECVFNNCEPWDYPFDKNPNEEQRRGAVAICKTGSNIYYKYNECDGDFELKTGFCQAQCQLKDCESNNSLGGYKNWSCAVKNKLNCKVGDAAYIGNAYLGVIGYQPEGNEETIIIATEKYGDIEPFGKEQLFNEKAAPSYFDDNGGQESGKRLTWYLLRYQQQTAEAKFPVIEACYKYSCPMCSGGFGGSHEWYLGSFADLKKTFENRFILYQVTFQDLFLGLSNNKNLSTWISNKPSTAVGQSFFYSRNEWSGGAQWTDKRSYFPIISYTQK